MRFRRTLRFAAALAATVSLAGGLAEPAAAVVGGAPAQTTRAGIGSLQQPRDGHPDWGTCSAHALALDGSGWTDLLVTAAQCVTVMPGAQSPQVRAMTDDGRARYAQYRRAAEDTGTATAATGRADRPAAGLHSTPEDPSSYRFVFGSVDRFRGEKAAVARFLIPKDWAWGQKDARGNVWDLALAQLAHPIRIRGAILAPVLPGPATVQGWGRDNPDPATWHGPLGPWLRQSADMRVTDPKTCADAGIGADELCLGPGTDRGGPCQGDAGSGAVQHLAGLDLVTMLVSRGPAPHCGTANVFTSVQAHGRWILDQIRALEPHARIAAADPRAIRDAAPAAQPDLALVG